MNEKYAGHSQHYWYIHCIKVAAASIIMILFPMKSSFCCKYSCFDILYAVKEKMKRRKKNIKIWKKNKRLD